MTERPNGYYVWTCHGRAAFAVTSLVWPWLGETKKADFKRCMRKLHESADTVRWHMRRSRVVYAEGGQ